MNLWAILTDLPKLTDTKNWNMKHTKPLETHFLYDLFFHVLTYKRSALGLFLRKGSLQGMCWLCAENLQRRVLKINSVGNEGRFRQRKELMLLYKRQNLIHSYRKLWAKIRAVLPWSKGTRTLYGPILALHSAQPDPQNGGVLREGSDLQPDHLWRVSDEGL